MKKLKMGFIRTGKFKSKKLRKEYLEENDFELVKETERNRVFTNGISRLCEDKLSGEIILMPTFRV